MDLSQKTEQQLLEHLGQIAARFGQFATESNAAQTSDLNEATELIADLDARFHHRVAIREQPQGSGHWAVVDL